MARLRTLMTTWGEELQKDPKRMPLPEYPRPSLVRQNWICLNGGWEYAVRKTPKEMSDLDTEDAGRRMNPDFGAADGTIRVPFSPECVLSGVERQLLPGERLWYRRSFSYGRAERERKKGHLLLHFGAADQIAWVWLNGHYEGCHTGGYLPFSFAVEDEIREGKNELVVCVRDDSDTVSYARGKQKLKAGGMFYTATSGIWQTVWLEEVPEVYIAGIETESDPGEGFLHIRIHCGGRKGTEQSTACGSVTGENEGSQGNSLSIKKVGGNLVHVQLRRPAVFAENYIRTQVDAVRLRQPVMQEFDVIPGEWTSIRMEELRLWTQDEPWLYGLTASIGKSGSGAEETSAWDETDSYCAVRSYGVGGRDIPARLLLNGKPQQQKGVLDQGYWSDGLYTAPSDEALIYDITEMKRLGFNMLRKHLKVEPERWYYHCDRLGMAVWQDMVCGGESYRRWFVTYGATLLQQFRIRISDKHAWLFARRDSCGRESFEKDMVDTVLHLKSHPCICTWVIFNEGWGQFDAARLTKLLRKADGEYSGRLIDSASGWFDQLCGDYQSVHHYYLRLIYRKRDKRIRVLSEFGGLPCAVKGHRAADKVYGYGAAKDLNDLNRKFRAMIHKAESLEGKGFSAYIYTQVSDVEEEINGILTFDRRVTKIHQKIESRMEHDGSM